MAQDPTPALSRRERQVMDVVVRRRAATAQEVLAGLAEPPSYSAVRATLRVLVDKGHLTGQHDGPRLVYRPTARRAELQQGALRRLVDTFFGGSPEDAFAALLDLSREQAGGDELERLSELIERAREEGR